MFINIKYEYNITSTLIDNNYLNVYC